MPSIDLTVTYRGNRRMHVRQGERRTVKNQVLNCSLQFKLVVTNSDWASEILMIRPDLQRF